MKLWIMNAFTKLKVLLKFGIVILSIHVKLKYMYAHVKASCLVIHKQNFLLKCGSLEIICVKMRLLKIILLTLPT